MVKKSVIETGVDKLVKLVGETKKISVKDAAKELGVSVGSVEEWADFLEEEGIISIQSQFATVYLIERQIGKKELVDKVRAVQDEKDQFVRRVESSINSLERDHEEIKLIDSEFKDIKSRLEGSFSKLSKKLEKLENYRQSHREIDEKKIELEEVHAKKLKELEQKLEKDKAEYDKVLSSVQNEVEQIKKEKAVLDSLKSSEKELSSKVDDVNCLLEKVRKAIDVENKHLDIDEERLKKAEEMSKSIQEHISQGSKDMVELSKQVKESRKQLEALESEFINDLERLKKGDLEKIGPYRESKELIEKVSKFFEKGKEIESLIHVAEKEEVELKQHFDNIVRKARTFSVLAQAPDIKKEIDSLHSELSDIESRKNLLGTQLKKLRNIFRSFVK